VSKTTARIGVESDSVSGDFISEDDLLTFEGWLKYQGAEGATPEELKVLRGYFDEDMRMRLSSPQVGLMKLRRIPGEQKYAVAIQEGSNLWLTMWVRCTKKGEIVILYPRADRASDPHATYHLDGTLHQKSYSRTGLCFQRQPLTAAFRGSEHLGAYGGHGISCGAVCNPKAFDGVVVVEPGMLGPSSGSVVVDLVEPGYAPRPDPGVYARQVFPRGGDRPSVVITVCRGNQVPYLHWPDSFVKAA
jgi:hypothetical protein